MSDDHYRALRQADQLRTDIANLESGLEVMMAQLAVIDHLTARGMMDPRLLYESPFTDLDPLGVAGVFQEGDVVQLIQILRDVQERAAANAFTADEQYIERAETRFSFAVW
jgi:hypothetical protein